MVTFVGWPIASPLLLPNAHVVSDFSLSSAMKWVQPYFSVTPPVLLNPQLL